MGNDLSLKLSNLAQIFDLDKIASRQIDQKNINKYYLVNKIPYSIFHTKKGFVHMGISKDGIYKETDLLHHARSINKMLNEITARRVLELATGRGGNSIWLARNNPKTSFIGIDISATQIHFARKHSAGLSNYQISRSDYHDLNDFADESMDLVFVIEALCHSDHKEKVLNEVFRILRKDGLFIIYDGYREKEENILSDNERLASRLLEVGVAVNHFDQYSEFAQLCEKEGFLIESEENLSEAVMPTMRRFEKQAARFLRFGYLAKLIVALLPKEFTYNVLSGYLFLTLIRDGVFSYRFTKLKKP